MATKSSASHSRGAGIATDRHGAFRQATVLGPAWVVLVPVSTAGVILGLLGVGWLRRFAGGG